MFGGVLEKEGKKKTNPNLNAACRYGFPHA